METDQGRWERTRCLCIGSAGACLSSTLQSQVLFMLVLPSPWGWGNVCLSLEVLVGEQDV